MGGLSGIKMECIHKVYYISLESSEFCTVWENVEEYARRSTWGRMGLGRDPLLPTRMSSQEKH